MSSRQSLRRAIALARAGHRLEAQNLLLRIVETDPDQELAWIWLSDLVEETPNRIIALKNALKVNPYNKGVRQRLQQLEQAYQKEQAERQRAAADSSRQQLRQVRAALQAGQQEKAVATLLDLVDREQDNEEAWWMLGQLTPDRQDQIIALENVLALNPNHEQARARLQTLRQQQENPLQAGLQCQERGDHEQALALYLAAIQRAQTEVERREARKHYQQLKRQLRAPKVKTFSPVITLLRQIAGLSTLYFFFILVQSGLSPRHFSLPFCLGGVGVLVASFLIALANTPFKHPLWRALFANQQLVGERAVRVLLALLGWVVFLGLHALFLADAASRLQALQATF